MNRPYDPTRDIVKVKAVGGNARDLCSRDGAEENARMIMEFWHRQGFWWVTAEVEEGRVWARRKGGNGEHERIYTVKTNLIGCLPPPKPRVDKDATADA